MGELPLGVQAKLLRLLQERCFERVGGNRSIAVNIRIIAATNRDLAEMVAAGTFREDLFYRLNVFPLMIPPLRERGDDVVALAEHFVAHYAAETEKNLAGLSPAAMNLLMRHNWPGNVRELENVIHRAVILAEGSVVHVYDLPLGLQQAETPATAQPAGLEARLASIEYSMVVETLRRCHGNTSKAAEILGLTRRSMGLRMKKFNLTFRQFRAEGQGGCSVAGGQGR